MAFLERGRRPSTSNSGLVCFFFNQKFPQREKTLCNIELLSCSVTGCPPACTRLGGHSSPSLCCRSSLPGAPACSRQPPSARDHGPPQLPLPECGCSHSRDNMLSRALVCSLLLRCPSPTSPLLKALFGGVSITYRHAMGVCAMVSLKVKTSTYLPTGSPEVCLGTFVSHFNHESKHINSFCQAACTTALSVHFR